MNIIKKNNHEMLNSGNSAETSSPADQEKTDKQAASSSMPPEQKTHNSGVYRILKILRDSDIPPANTKDVIGTIPMQDSYFANLSQTKRDILYPLILGFISMIPIPNEGLIADLITELAIKAQAIDVPDDPEKCDMRNITGDDLVAYIAKFEFTTNQLSAIAREITTGYRTRHIEIVNPEMATRLRTNSRVRGIIPQK